MADDDHVRDIAIYKAALHDDWKSVSTMFKDNPSLMTKRITQVGETPLHIAVGTNCSNDFVEKLVQCIVDIGEKEIEKLFEKNAYGNNPLHVAAMVGNMHATQVLLKHNPDKTQTLVPNKDRNMPLHLAAWHGNKETLKYLLKETPKPDEEKGISPYTREAGEPDEEKGISSYTREAGEPDEEKGISSYTGEAGEPDEEKGISPYTGEAGGNLITRTIMAGFYDVALDIIEKHPGIVFEKDSSKESPKTALEILAQKPENFASGRSLGLWGSFIYSLIPVKNDEGTIDHSKRKRKK